MTSSSSKKPENMQNIQSPASGKQQQQDVAKLPPPPPVNQSNPGQQGNFAVNQPYLYPAQPGYPMQLKVEPSAYPGQHVVYVQPDNRNALRSGLNPFEPNRDYGSVDQQFNQGAFADSTIRRVFVRKVYLILSIQLIFTFAVISLFVFEPHVNTFARTNPSLVWVSLGLFFVVYLILGCYAELRRTFPWNIVALVAFTLSASCLFGFMSSFHRTEAVLCAVGICAVVCSLVTLLSFYAKFDFTDCFGIFLILSVVLIIVGLVAIITQNKTMIYVYGGLGAIVFTMFLACDTQQIMGGKSIEITPEDYIYAVMQLYMDVLMIYMFILMLFGMNPS